MTTTRRAVLAAAGAAFASAGPARTAQTAAAGPDATPIAALLALSAESNTALMKGDIDRYRELIQLSDDFTLMSPFGGAPTHGRDMNSERWAAMGRFFRHGTFAQEVVQAYGTAEMVVLAIIERSHVEVGGLPAQEWPLRVTLVYQRQGTRWVLAHRHADPLVTGVSHATAAAIARAEIR
jgi:hypothetical protein